MDATTRPRRRLESDWDWLEFAAELPSVPLPLLPTGNNSLIMSGRLLLRGISAGNSSTVATFITLYDGTSTNAKVVGLLSIPASSDGNVTFDSHGTLCEIGLFAANGPGAVTGVAYVVPLWHYPATPPGE